MSVVAIVSKYSRESLELAEHTAAKLDYRLVTMDDLVKAAAEQYHEPEKDLRLVVKDRRLWHHKSRKKQMKLLSLLEQELCRQMKEDRLVFCGCLGYPIFREISHALKVLVLAHPETGRTAASQAFPAPEMVSDDGMAAWFEKTYQAGLEDPNLYDLTLNLWHMDTGEAADVIVSTLNQQRFKPMTYSLNCMDNLELACQVKTALVEKLGDVAVKSHDGTVYVYSGTFKKWGRKAAKAIKEEVMSMPGVNYVEVYRQRGPFDEISI